MHWYFHKDSRLFQEVGLLREKPAGRGKWTKSLEFKIYTQEEKLINNRIRWAGQDMKPTEMREYK